MEVDGEEAAAAEELEESTVEAEAEETERRDKVSYRMNSWFVVQTN